MPKRENKATIKDEGLEDAFRQGFDEGMRQAAGAEVIYEFTATFEGTDLRRVQFSDLDQCLAEARELLLNGHGTQVTIVAVAVPTQQAGATRAVASADQAEVDVEDAEVVEDDPSRAE
jgi:hypothetical protein